jgi:CheY-like chemotaxis protein
MDKVYTILLVDDDEEDRQIFMDALDEIDPGISCITAGDGRAALRLLEEQPVLPDIIFLDLNMQGMDGWQFLGEKRKNSRFEAIPVVIYSTSSHVKDIKETKELGAAGFITKPVLFDDICLKVGDALATIGGFVKSGDR